MRAINVAVQFLQELYSSSCTYMYTVVYQSPLTVGIRCSPCSARRCAVLYHNYAPRFSQYKYTYAIGYPTNMDGVASAWNIQELCTVILIMNKGVRTCMGFTPDIKATTATL